MTEEKRPRISEQCNHQYSKSIDQEYPRKCTICGDLEISTEEIKEKLAVYVQYFTICDTLDNNEFDKAQVESLHKDLYELEQVCKENLPILINYLKLI